METQTHHGQPFGICATCGCIFRVTSINEVADEAVCPACRRAESEAARDRIARAAYQERLHRETVRVTRTVDPETGNIIEWRR